MVHPNVLRNVGIDPEEYSGFACGNGRRAFNDVTLQCHGFTFILENDLRFLKQFK
ncbi:Phenylalanine--tRNA ligase alpha subunit [Mannheimia haemolytica]|uniref:Phenylalanine--tRNA ligase alpha subunit n=1 Tax=Mannheimia haemolytica TaxID=75985 RepID=A0A378MZQ4_MANHA|nr:Phenylalanine--tRNA ligase alpha subunit [Mannheimia haemolytica]